MVSTKVVLLVTQLEAGGAQNVAIKITDALNEIDEFGCETWFLYRKKEAFPDQFKRIISEDKPSSIFGYFKLLYNTYAQLKNYKPDVLITFTHYSNVLIQPLAFLAGIKVRIANHRNPRHTYSTFVRVLDSVWGLTGVYQKIVMVSKAVKASFNMVSNRYLSKMEVIYNGIDVLDFSSDSEKEIRKKWNIEPDKCVLLNVGRLAKQKNQGFLLEVIKALNKIHLIIVGEGELRKELEDQIERNCLSNKVTLTGQIEQKEVHDLMKIASVFVMPSRFEGMSNALLESLQAGLPVIASNVPAQAELLEENNERFGVLLNIEDKKAWKKAIADICNDTELQEFWREKSFKRAKDFTTAKMIEHYKFLIADSYEKK